MLSLPIKLPKRKEVTDKNLVKLSQKFVPIPIVPVDPITAAAALAALIAALAFWKLWKWGTSDPQQSHDISVHQIGPGNFNSERMPPVYTDSGSIIYWWNDDYPKWVQYNIDRMRAVDQSYSARSGQARPDPAAIGIINGTMFQPRQIGNPLNTVTGPSQQGENQGQIVSRDMTEEENKNQDSRIREFMYNNAIIADYMNGVITYQNALSRITENGIDSLEQHHEWVQNGLLVIGPDPNQLPEFNSDQQQIQESAPKQLGDQDQKVPQQQQPEQPTLIPSASDPEQQQQPQQYQPIGDVDPWPKSWPRENPNDPYNPDVDGPLQTIPESNPYQIPSDSQPQQSNPKYQDNPETQPKGPQPVKQQKPLPSLQKGQDDEDEDDDTPFGALGSGKKKDTPQKRQPFDPQDILDQDQKQDDENNKQRAEDDGTTKKEKCVYNYIDLDDSSWAKLNFIDPDITSNIKRNKIDTQFPLTG